ncbi:FkbM family methyltransferase, partial [Vibrio sp. 10N.261.49.A5]
MFDLAKKTVEYNNLDEKIVLNKLALGDKRENQTIQVADDFSSFYHRSDNEDKIETEVVNIETLDDYVARNNIDVGVIKVDVEGYEEKLLDGAIRTITRDKPALILSIYHSSEQFFWIKNKIEELDLGYTFKIRKPLDRSIIVDTMLIAEVID